MTHGSIIQMVLSKHNLLSRTTWLQTTVNPLVIEINKKDSTVTPTLKAEIIVLFNNEIRQSRINANEPSRQKLVQQGRLQLK